MLKLTRWAHHMEKLHEDGHASGDPSDSPPSSSNPPSSCTRCEERCLSDGSYYLSSRAREIQAKNAYLSSDNPRAISDNSDCCSCLYIWDHITQQQIAKTGKYWQVHSDQREKLFILGRECNKSGKQGSARLREP